MEQLNRQEEMVMEENGMHPSNPGNKMRDTGKGSIGGSDRFEGRGQGPQGGQGHNGESARLSDRGSHGGAREGGPGQELGSHGGHRREHQNPGPERGRKGSGH
jgi:hypothetical protein